MAEQANPNHGQQVRRTARSKVVKKFGGLTAEASSATQAMEQIEASVRRLVDLKERIGSGVIVVQSAKHIGLAVPDDSGYTMAVIAKSASSVETFAATTLTGDDKEGAEMSLRYLSDRLYFRPLGRRVTHHCHKCLRCQVDGPWRLRLWAKEMLPGDESILQDLPQPTRWQSFCRRVNNVLAVTGLAAHKEGEDYFV